MAKTREHAGTRNDNNQTLLNFHYITSLKKFSCAADVFFAG